MSCDNAQPCQCGRSEAGPSLRLIRLNNEADKLLPKLQAIAETLERIRELSNALPDEMELEPLVRLSRCIAENLESVPELVENLPDENELERLVEQSAAIAANLPEAGE